MATNAPEPGARPQVAQAGRRGGAQIDWLAAEQSAEFRELTAKRRAFVVPGTVFYLVVFFSFILLSSYAKEFMGTQIVSGFTWGYLLALVNILMTFVLCGMYISRASRVFDPLSVRAAEAAVRGHGDHAHASATPTETEERAR